LFGHSLDFCPLGLMILFPVPYALFRRVGWGGLDFAQYV
jgi:hypothetical protein